MGILGVILWGKKKKEKGCPSTLGHEVHSRAGVGDYGPVYFLFLTQALGLLVYLPLHSLWFFTWGNLWTILWSPEMAVPGLCLPPLQLQPPPNPVLSPHHLTFFALCLW